MDKFTRDALNVTKGQSAIPVIRSGIVEFDVLSEIISSKVWEWTYRLTETVSGIMNQTARG